jgi:hypothetical protein
MARLSEAGIRLTHKVCGIAQPDRGDSDHVPMNEGCKEQSCFSLPGRAIEHTMRDGGPNVKMELNRDDANRSVPIVRRTRS